MKWFKHDAHSLSKANIEKLIMEFGMEGYGLYYACLEMIAGTIETSNITFELEHDAKIIAHKFKMDTLQVETIMHRCIEYGLFDLADTGKLRCLQLARMIDDSTSRNPEFIQMQKSLIESGLMNSEKFGKIRKNFDQNRIEENRIEDINTGNTEEAITYSRLFIYWNDRVNTQKHKDITTFTNNFKKTKLKQILKEYTPDDIEQAIHNYDIILGDEKYYFKYKWTLWEFLSRGLSKFVSAAVPFTNYLIKNHADTSRDDLYKEKYDIRY